MNLIDTLTLFGAVALAGPIGLLGVEFLLGSRPVAGAGFLAIAIALVAGGYYRPSIKGIVTGGLASTMGDDEETYKD